MKQEDGMKYLTVPARIAYDIKCDIAVEYDNKPIEYREVYDELKKPIIRSLFNVAIAAAANVNVYDVVNNHSENNQPLLILDGQLCGRSIKVYITNPVFTNESWDNYKLLYGKVCF